MKRFIQTRSGYTLVETLVVISLLGILVGLTLPAVQRVRQSANKTKCQNNLKQVGIGLHHFHSVFQSFPLERRLLPTQEMSWLGAVVHLLPYIDERPLWELVLKSIATTPIGSNANVSIYPNAQNHPASAQIVKIFICPNDTHIYSPVTTKKIGLVSLVSYLGVSGSRNFQDGTVSAGVLTGMSNGVSISEITDGTSQTFMIGERTPPLSFQAGHWYSPRIIQEPWGGPDGGMIIPAPGEFSDFQCSHAYKIYGSGNVKNPCDRYHFWSQHGGGAHFLFADGSVRFIPYTTTTDVLLALASRSKGETINLPD